MAVVTKFSVKDIQLIIRNSWLCDQRSDLIVPNVSWGLLSYEADLIVVKKSDIVYEFEIKRSFEDFKKDFEKDHHHDDPIIAVFYYVVPEKIADKVKSFLIEHYKVMENCPAVLYFCEDGQLKVARDEQNNAFGVAKRKHYEHITQSQRATLGRLVSIRYWNAQSDICKTGYSAKDRKINDLKFSLKKCTNHIKELNKLNGADKWIKPSNYLPDDTRTVMVRHWGGYGDGVSLAYFDKENSKWFKQGGEPFDRWVYAWCDILAYQEALEK